MGQKLAVKPLLGSVLEPAVPFWELLATCGGKGAYMSIRGIGSAPTLKPLSFLGKQGKGINPESSWQIDEYCDLASPGWHIWDEGSHSAWLRLKSRGSVLSKWDDKTLAECGERHIRLDHTWGFSCSLVVLLTCSAKSLITGSLARCGSPLGPAEIREVWFNVGSFDPMGKKKGRGKRNKGPLAVLSQSNRAALTRGLRDQEFR